MPARSHRPKFRALLLGVVLFSACLPSLRRTPANAVPARRLVLALDGIDYRDIVAARERGLFAGFREPSRLISTFPSISDIAWHEIFGVQAPRGYQRIYYSAAHNEVIGVALDAIRPIEFEDRMDMAFGAKFHHLGAYLISNTIAKHEIDVVVGDFFKFADRNTIYVYNVGPDALQHTRGDLAKYLDHLDQKLEELQAKYLQRTARALEIVVVSDHGHNRAVDAKFLPVVKALQSHGFRIADELRSATDVAFSVDGVTTGFGVFALPESIAPVAELLASMEGVDVVSVRVSDDRFSVKANGHHAEIERKRSARGDLFRYVATEGDPLQYVPIIERMRREKVLDAEGFADSPTWIRYSSSSRYPVALERIVRGHTVVTLNPAPILVSLTDEYRVGLGMVSVANRMRPLGGTHGALSSSNALGVLMTNFRDTHDDITVSASRQLDGFADLGAVRYKSSGARLTNSWLLSRDARGPFHGIPDTTAVPAQSAALEVWLTPKQRAWATDDGAFFLELWRRGDPRENAKSTLMATSYLPIRPAKDAEKPGWIVAADGRRYALPLSRLGAAPFAPSSVYDLRVIVDRVSRQGSVASTISRDIATLTLRTNARGELWPY